MTIRQGAFTCKDRKMLKGALHCHTTRSDGRGEPGDVIRLHAQNGYDFMALTDHRVYNYENFAPEIPMTIVPGMEFDNTFFHDHGFRCFHTVCIGPSRADGNGYEQDQRFESGTAVDQEGYQPYLDDIHAHRNLTIYCHPEWSSTPARYFEKLRGNFAMEIWNSGCVIENNMDKDAAYWDELLGQGIRIFGVATDDGHAMSQHCRGWVMVNAENNLNAILAALEAGNFYSSTGPVIRDFYVEDGTAHIECEPCARICLSSDCHPTRMLEAEDDSLTHFEVGLDGGWVGGYRYVRFTVYKKDGSRAWTNPIWRD